MESQLCDGDEVIIVGGGNSAGQAAVFLAQTVKRVHLLVRSSSLSASMSRYLIDASRRLQQSSSKQEPRSWRLRETNSLSVSGGATPPARKPVHDLRHVFLMTGAEANTAWLNGRVALDAKGFIKTGWTDQGRSHRCRMAARPLTHLLETSLPGVFAVGDVRCGSVKRVASAVGEGSISVSFVHRALAE